MQLTFKILPLLLTKKCFAYFMFSLNLFVARPFPTALL